MSDFVIRKKEESASEAKLFSFGNVTKKELSIPLRFIAFFATFSGLIYLSINSGNLLLSEILVVGGILSIVFFMHMLSNR